MVRDEEDVEENEDDDGLLRKVCEHFFVCVFGFVLSFILFLLIEFVLFSFVLVFDALVLVVCGNFRRVALFLILLALFLSIKGPIWSSWAYLYVL